MFKNMGGNFPGGNFPGGSVPDTVRFMNFLHFKNFHIVN